MFRRKKLWGTREIHPRDARLPGFEVWPGRGIAGTIRSGPDAGKPVLIVRDETPGDTFLIWLPEERLENGDFWFETDAADTARPLGEGGLADYLTTGWDVEWSLDAEDFENARLYWRNHALWRASEGENPDN